MPLVPWLVGLLIGAAIALLGTTTGGSVNPARQFGPAIAAGRLDFLWVYLLAPLVGAFLASALCSGLLSRRAGEHAGPRRRPRGDPQPRTQPDTNEPSSRSGRSG
ncbi:aquaporin [Streptomyces sp. NPDC002520]